MKKWFIIPILLIALFGCNDENTEPPTDKETPVEEENIQNIKEQQQLAKVLIELVETYGMIHPNIEFHEPLGDLAFGVIFADLIDFDNDGQKELYVLFRSSEYANDSYEHRNQRGYIEEVWGISKEEPVLLRNAMYDYDDQSLASDLTLSFVTLQDGTVAIKHFHVKMSQGIQRWADTFYTLNENSFTKTEFEHLSGNSDENIPEQFFINNETTDEENFVKEMKKFAGEERFIFQSSAGTKEFSIDLSDPLKTISEIVNTLTEQNNKALIDNEQVSITSELQNAFNFYRDFRKIDVRDEDLHPTMLYELIFNGLIEKDAPGQGFYSTAFTKDTLRKAMKKYYNLDVDPSSFGLPKDFSTMELLVYENDVLYIIDSSFYDDYQLVYIPEKVVQVSDDLYYGKVQVKAFDYWAFHEAHTDVDYTEFWDLPLDMWPDITKAYLEDQLPSYLLMKKNGNAFQLLYQGKYNLLDEELKEFQ